MDSTLIFVQCNGVWDESGNYTKFEMVGISINQACKYDEIIHRIAEQLKINLLDHMLVLKYQLKTGYPPIAIRDDESFQFYKELRMRESDYTKFPLCTSVTEMRRCATNSLTVNDQFGGNNGIVSDKMRRLRDAMLRENTHSEFSILEFANNAANSILNDVDQFLEVRGKETRKPIEAMRTDNKDDDVRVGQMFKSEDLLKKTLSFCAISQKYSFKVVKSCEKQYYIACLHDKCNWFFNASRVGKSTIFQVREFNNIHTCPLDIRMNEQRQATSQVVSDCIKRKYCDLKTIYTPADIMRDMLDDYGVDLSYKKAWRAKKKAVDEVRGKPDESYNIISSYLKMVTDANPGSFARVKKSDDLNFQYLFLSLYASIKGWHHCRPIVVVDGTFLKSSYGGTLLTASVLKSSYGGTLLMASVQDANSHILPIAFAIVDSENDKAYEWFFENLKGAIGSRLGMCIVSDRNESLVKAVTKVYPGVAQCYCMYHLGKNLKRHFKRNTQVVQQTFISAAMAYTVDDFDNHMRELYLLDHRVVEYLNDVGVEHWARAHCPNN